MKKEALSLPGPAVMELIAAVHEKGAVFRFKAAGFSMRPSIRNNDVITISPLKGIPPFLGEVVAFRHPKTGSLIIHRVVGKKQGVFFIKGDRLRQVDGHIPLENIIGTVIKVERVGRRIFWPDRFRRRLRAKLYFKGFLTWLRIRRVLRAVPRLIVSFADAGKEPPQYPDDKNESTG